MSPLGRGLSWLIYSSMIPSLYAAKEGKPTEMPSSMVYEELISSLSLQTGPHLRVPGEM